MSRLLLVLSLLAGCSSGGEGGEGVVCAGQDPFHAGTFSSPRGEWTGTGQYFSHAGTGAKTMVIEHLDDDTALLRITYQRAGKTVVEIWKGSTGHGDAPPRLGWSDKPPVRYGFQVPSNSGEIGVAVG